MVRLLIFITALAATACAQEPIPMLDAEQEFVNVESPDLHIEVWSDVVCPFCYLGKRRLERVLAQIAAEPTRQQTAATVRVEWKSFELDPERVTRPDVPTATILAEDKGLSPEQVQGMMAHVARIAAPDGLTYDFDRSISANTFRAHVLLHYAKLHGKQHAVKERLFAAQFTEGANVDDVEALIAIAVAAGLPEAPTRAALDNPDLANDVRMDEYEARTVGVRGVPFFLINGEHAISGAQPAEVFEQVLRAALQEAEAKMPFEGPVCNPDAGCDR